MDRRHKECFRKLRDIFDEYDLEISAQDGMVAITFSTSYPNTPTQEVFYSRVLSRCFSFVLKLKVIDIPEEG